MDLVHWSTPLETTNKTFLPKEWKQGPLTTDTDFLPQGHGRQKWRRVGLTETLTLRSTSKVTIEIVYCADCAQAHGHDCPHECKTWQAPGVDTLGAYQLRISIDRQGSPSDTISRLSVLSPKSKPTWRDLFDQYSSELRSGESLTLQGWTPSIDRGQRLRILTEETSEDDSRLLEEFGDEYGDPPPSEGDQEDEYAYEVAKNMLELEAKYVINLNPSTNAEEREKASTTRRKAIELIEHACESFDCLLDTLWLSIHIFDRYCLSQHEPGPVRRWQLLSIVCFLLAVKSTETMFPPVSEVCEIVPDCSDLVSEEVYRGQLVVLKKLNYDLFLGYSPWFWICSSDDGKGLTRYVQDFLVQVAIRDEGMASIRPSLLAAAVIHATKRMGLMGGNSERDHPKLAVLRGRYGEKEVIKMYRKLVKKLRMSDEEQLGRLYRRYAGEQWSGASKFAVKWAWKT